MLKSFELNSKYQEPYYTTETTIDWNTAVKKKTFITFLFIPEILQKRADKMFSTSSFNTEFKDKNIFQRTSKSLI